MERAVQKSTDDLPSTVRAGQLFNVWLQCTVRVRTLSQEVGTRESQLVYFVLFSIISIVACSLTKIHYILFKDMQTYIVAEQSAVAVVWSLPG
jgi:hypothetical protein